MKNKFATIIMSIIIILIIGIISIFGIILWEEIQQTETSIEPESFKTVFSENSNTVNKNIETPAVKENVFDDIKDSNQNTSVDYSNIKVDKYFYNQLEDESKTIYKAFEANQENLKTGNYKIELGNSFSNLLKKEDGQEQLGKYYQSAFEAYNYDNPDVFYLDPNKMYLNIETTTSRNGNTYNVYINTGEQNNYFTDDFSSKEQVDTASQKIEKVKNAYPAYYGTYKKRNKIIKYLNEFENIYFIGRAGQHQYIDMDKAMMSAIKASENIIKNKKTKKDVWL